MYGNDLKSYKTPFPVNCYVLWSEEFFHYELEDVNHKHSFALYPSHILEVIGNLHKNPELMV